MNYLKTRKAINSLLMNMVLLVLAMSYGHPMNSCFPKRNNAANCHFSNIDNDISSSNFSALAPKNITNLIITCSWSRITIQPRTFVELYRLQQITILNCYLHLIGEDMFAGLDELKSLSIWNSFNLSIHLEAFHHVPNLETLKIVNSTWDGLSPNSLCKLKKIRVLDFSKNKISSLFRVLGSCGWSFFSELTNLQLGFNQIQIIESDFVEMLANLRILILKENRIEKIQNRALTNMSQLRNLDLSHNYLTQMPDDFLSGCFELQTLIISNNSITEIPSAIRDLKNLRELNLRQNSISKVPSSIFENCNELQVLDLSTNNISTLFKESFEGLEHLRKLDLSNNNIPSVNKETIQNLTGLHELNLSFNYLSEIPSFKANLLLLYLANNCIQKIGDDDFQSLQILFNLDLKKNNLIMLNKNAFKDLRGLVSLDISYNSISDIYNAFDHSDRLQAINAQHNLIHILRPNTFPKSVMDINLTYNQIEQVEEGTFANLTRLREVDLRMNKLMTLNQSSLKVSSKYAKSKFYISGNPLQCDCKFAWLKEDEIKKSEIGDDPKFQDLETVTCFEHEKRQLLVLQYVKDSCGKKLENKRLLYGLSISLVLIVAVFVMGTFLFVYRFEIQILLFVHFNWRILDDRSDDEDKKYDAFVSFHSSQELFVINEMLPRLEGTEPAYKLCINLRDFLAGAAIVDNITEGIDNSKRTILLISNEFLRNEWCWYEYQAAHLDALSSKLNNLILVLIEDINQDLVDGGLKVYMKTKTYLRLGDPRFWDKLRFALPKIEAEKTLNGENASKILDVEEHLLSARTQTA